MGTGGKYADLILINTLVVRAVREYCQSESGREGLKNEL